MQTMFIRFGGCDYRCGRCDSLHAVLPRLIKKNATWQTTQEIVDTLTAKSGHCRLVTFSGGNPLMWDLSDLVMQLKNLGWKIAVETQGSLWRDWINECDYITISPKGPGMQEKFELDKFVHFLQETHWSQSKRGIGIGGYRGANVCIKVVVFSQEDIEFAKQIAVIIKSYQLPLFLSLGNPWPPEPAKREDNPQHWGEPASSTMSDSLLSRMLILWEDIKNEPLLADARFLPQMHVLLWANQQGV